MAASVSRWPALVPLGGHGRLPHRVAVRHAIGDYAQKDGGVRGISSLTTDQ
jgi:hypothetical protein